MVIVHLDVPVDAKEAVHQDVILHAHLVVEIHVVVHVHILPVQQDVNQDVQDAMDVVDVVVHAQEIAGHLVMINVQDLVPMHVVVHVLDVVVGVADVDQVAHQDVVDVLQNAQETVSLHVQQHVQQHVQGNVQVNVLDQLQV